MDGLLSVAPNCAQTVAIYSYSNVQHIGDYMIKLHNATEGFKSPLLRSKKRAMPNGRKFVPG
jgi:hypothetical protein